MSQENVSSVMKEAGSVAIVVINAVAILYMLWHFVVQAEYWIEKKIEKLRHSSSATPEMELTQQQKETWEPRGASLGAFPNFASEGEFRRSLRRCQLGLQCQKVPLIQEKEE